MTDSLLFQIQIVNNVRLVNKVHYCVEENYMTIFSSFSANFPYHTILEINCVHASNWFTHLPPTWQTDDQMTILLLLWYSVA